MKVFLTTAYQDESPQLRRARELAELDRHKVHTLVDNPEEADLILFVERDRGLEEDSFFEQVRNHPLTEKYRTKTLMFNRRDNPLYVIPGLYTSLHDKHPNLAKMRATPFILDMNELIHELAESNTEPDILYSFMGARTADVRIKLFSMKHPRGIVIDTTGFSVFFLPDDPQMILQRKQEYADLLARSKLVLCPRGMGFSSYRLYETMRMGRVPVILSDNWVPPLGVNWDSFAVFVSEQDLNNIRHIMEEFEQSWEERGKLAREAWETFFAPDVLFHYIIEQCKEILETSEGNEDFFKLSITHEELYRRVLVGPLAPIYYRFRFGPFGFLIKMIKPIIDNVLKYTVRFYRLFHSRN